MFEMMNRQRAKLKKNGNKGFTLIELIVVILIIAIIAVALAPQVVKYVQQSREATDSNNMATIKSTVSTAYADYLAAGGDKLTSDVSFDFTKDGVNGIGNDDLESKIEEISGEDYPEVQEDSDKVFHVSISYETGKVTVTEATPTTKTN